MKVFRIQSHRGHDRLKSFLRNVVGQEDPQCHYLRFTRPETPGYFFLVPDEYVAEARKIKGVSATRLPVEALAPCWNMVR